MATDLPHRPTIIDVARKAGLSKSTVSAAFLDYSDVSPKTRERILLVARQMGYSPNVQAATLATRKDLKPATSSVAMVNHFESSDEQESYKRGLHSQTIQRRLSELGYDSSIYNLGPQLSCEKLRKLLYSRGYAGIIFDEIRDYADEIFSMDWEPFSLVCWGRTYRDPPCDFLRTSSFDSVCLAWNEIRKGGYRRIGFLLCRHRQVLLDDLERQGALAACQANRRRGEKAIPPFLGDFGDREGIKSWFLRHEPDVVVGFNDWHYHLLQEMGIRVPEDVKYANLIKFDPDDGTLAGIHHMEAEVCVKTAEHIDFLIRHRKRGFPEARCGTLTPIRWIPGESLPVKSG
jgi:DNA-binding LacI/PurR family transcriptional regulator